MRQPSLNISFLGHLEDSKIFKHTVLVTKWPSFRKPRLIWAIDKKIFSLSLKIFFSIWENFSVFRRGPPIRNFLKFLKMLNFSMTMRSWTLLMVPLFSVSDPLSENLTICTIWPNFKLSIFYHRLIWPNSLYLGNLEDLGNVVGDVFGHYVMQTPNIETVFESKQIWNFLFCACADYLYMSILSVTLRN